MERKVVIIGAGAAGLSAAIQLAKCNVSSVLVSDMPSERAQSVMAEGGINAALGKEDDPSIHQKETWEKGRCVGCILYHRDRDELKFLQTDAMIMACGGLNGIFGNATGSVLNTGSAAASLFADGVWFSNLEFVQYHPTTVKLHGKNLLMTEAIRGEGGRLFIKKRIDRIILWVEFM